MASDERKQKPLNTKSTEEETRRAQRRSDECKRKEKPLTQRAQSWGKRTKRDSSRENRPRPKSTGTGLLVKYDSFSEPSAPEEEPTSWFQVFGVLNGKLVPFGAPLEVQGGLVDEYAKAGAYKAARALGAQADIIEFKGWTGNCRLIFPVRVDWAQGKLSLVQECVNTAGELGPGCHYKVLPEDKLRNDGVTFVRLWPGPHEKSGQTMTTVVKKDSKVELLTALVATHWLAGNPTGVSNAKGLLDEAGSFGADGAGGAADSGPDLWLKVRIDGKEGWMHSEEDFCALGLPEDE